MVDFFDGRDIGTRVVVAGISGYQIRFADVGVAENDYSECDGRHGGGVCWE